MLLAAVDDPGSELSPGLRAKLTSARDYLAVAPGVVRVVRDLPVPRDVELTVPRSPVDPQAVVDLARRWGLDTPLARLVDALSRA
jgi:hypothetical protein